MIKKRNPEGIVFDKDYKAFGRIVKIETNKKSGNIEIIWIDLFPDTKHKLHWKSAEAIPVKIKDFKSTGEFNKLRFDLKELKKTLNNSKDTNQRL